MTERNRNQDEARKDAFQAHVKAAKDLGDKALHDIDAVLADEERLRLSLIQGDCGELTPDEISIALANYHKNRHPILDEDTLASPLGYFEPPESLWR